MLQLTYLLDFRFVYPYDTVRRPTSSVYFRPDDFIMAADSEDILLRIKQSLEGGPYECTTLEKLTGGTANFVYRGALTKPLDDGSKTVVVKHTESYVASHPNFKLASNRCVSLWMRDSFNFHSYT